MSRLRLRQLMVLSRDLAKSKHFYQEGLGLKLLRSSDTFAEFDTQTGVPLCVTLAQSSGYSPFLNFDIPDLSDAVPRLLMLGAIMDGPIKYPAHGKTAALRSPDGVMIGLRIPTLVELRYWKPLQRTLRMLSTTNWGASICNFQIPEVDKPLYLACKRAHATSS
ncbi:hypothetical protein PsorP6_002349 [Peronosclerospora sorghi]|uniref:Uncharacterized protein n=1 Tax=Peronosclerospora sorghi TaxID=230839 RepID=A0ACC0WTJ5_9STRA|nr:hypothetical protein PsorP6_002349 [Peronosclerospora sorghi]